MSYGTLKRGLDIVGAIFLGLVFLPVFVALIIMIGVSAKGQILLKQIRVGKDGQKFQMYKFYTMHADAALYDLAPENLMDERVTVLGKWLRRGSLDELPQLWNVLTGTMSLVGPRPEMAFIVEKYNDYERQRLEVKPGLTGLWQVSGRKDIPLQRNLKYDIEYVKHQSIALDLWILAKTIPAVLSGRGAY